MSTVGSFFRKDGGEINDKMDMGIQGARFSARVPLDVTENSDNTPKQFEKLYYWAESKITLSHRPLVSMTMKIEQHGERRMLVCVLLLGPQRAGKTI